MKLYTFKNAPNPLRLGLFMAEKGIDDIPTETIDLMKKEQFADSFKAINPMMTVPVLVTDDGTVLTEVVAMYSYLEDQYPDIPLLGNSAVDRAQVLGWDHRCFNEGVLAVAEVLRNSNEAFKGRGIPGATPVDQIPALVERGHKRLAAFYQILEIHLAGQSKRDSGFMVGGDFSAADIAAYVLVTFSGWIKCGIPPECTALESWFKTVSARSAFVRHLGN